MEDFVFHVPTRILFGKDQLDHLGEEIKQAGGHRVLLAYGGGSIKKNGVYDRVTQALEAAGLSYAELSGIEPNPHLDTAIRGIELVKKEGLDFVLPVGGGSTIDCSKLVAAGAMTEADPWDIVLGKAEVTGALPIGVVLTLAATGSEMDNSSVITNTGTKEKLGWGSDLVLPKFSIMDPEFTYSVNAWHTAAGTADIMSHTMESYFFLDDSTYVQDSMAEGVLRTCVKYGPIAVKEPDNYEARANLMWAGTWAINGLLETGKSHAWSVHPLEHELSAQYDITHGVGLAIITPRWLKHYLNDKTQARIVRFGRRVFDLDLEDSEAGAMAAIQALYDFFQQDLGIPMTLKDLGIDDSRLADMAQAAIDHREGVIQGFQPIDVADGLAIFQACLEEGLDA